ncbi:MAG TPA: DoxX family protein [Flavihumibacter sp.]
MLSKESLYKQSNNVQELLLRFFLLYFLLQALPLSVQLFQALTNREPGEPLFATLFRLARIQPGLTSADSFLNWLLIAILAALGAGYLPFAFWNDPVKKQRFIYLVRTLVSYRLAASLFVYGLLKFYPVLAPYPSLSNLNTAYGDFERWKLFSLSLGVVPGYESFLGAVEIAAGLLLLFRKTAGLGALIIAVFLGNVFMSNLAYEGGEVVYSFYLLSLALFVFAFDFVKLYNLVVLQAPAAPETPTSGYLSGAWKKGTWIARALVLIVFLGLFGFTTKKASEKNSYQFPASEGTLGLTGVYDVEFFAVNGKALPWDPYDPVRWKDVVIESWPTISIRSNKPVKVFHSNLEHFSQSDFNRTYELEGTGGRHYYQYEYHPDKKQLQLINKNPNHAGEGFDLVLEAISDSTILVKGTDEQQNQYEALLRKKDKKYLLEVARETGRRQRIKL